MYIIFLNFKKGKKIFIAVDYNNGYLEFLNDDFNLVSEFKGNYKIVTYLGEDENDDYLFIAYKYGFVISVNTPEENNENENDDIKKTIEIQYNIDTNDDNDKKAQINTFLYETKIFKYFPLGSDKGLIIQEINEEKNLAFIDFYGDCL